MTFWPGITYVTNRRWPPPPTLAFGCVLPEAGCSPALASVPAARAVRWQPCKRIWTDGDAWNPPSGLAWLWHLEWDVQDASGRQSRRSRLRWTRPVVWNMIACRHRGHPGACLLRCCVKPWQCTAEKQRQAESSRPGKRGNIRAKGRRRTASSHQKHADLIFKAYCSVGRHVRAVANGSQTCHGAVLRRVPEERHTLFM